MLSTNLHGFLNLLHNLMLEGRFTEDIVRSNAGLATIHVFPPSYAPEVGEKMETPQNSIYYSSATRFSVI